MKMKRRRFIKTSLAAGAAFAVPSVFDGLAASGEEKPVVLPWQREMPLREAAQSVFLESVLNPQNPLPDSGGFGRGGSMAINNLKMRTTIWGTPDRITISMNKNNVWDRRLNLRSLEAPVLQEIIDGVFSPANKD